MTEAVTLPVLSPKRSRHQPTPTGFVCGLIVITVKDNKLSKVGFFYICCTKHAFFCCITYQAGGRGTSKSNLLKMPLPTRDPVF